MPQLFNQGARVDPALQAGKAVGQDATGQKGPELVLHEHRQAGALGAVSRRVKERIQVRFDDSVQYAAFGVARRHRARRP